MTLPVRLVHGPFDGDEGGMQKLPRTIWATDCLQNHGTTSKGTQTACNQGGVHWSGDPTSSALHAIKERTEHLGIRCERYKKDREVDGVRTYVWADVRGNPKVGKRSRVPEPVGTHG